MDRQTLIEMTLNTSAKVGEVFVPAGSLETHLGRFASQLLVWNHDDLFKVSTLGSGTGVQHIGRSLLVCSGHQLRGCELRDVGLLLPDGSSMVTSAGSRTILQGENTVLSDAYDVAAFDFSEPLKENPSLRHQFFQFREPPPDAPNSEIVAFIVVGFPSKDQKYELAEKNHLGIVRRILVAEPESQPSDESLIKLRFVNPLDFDPDGLSGGPAFVVQVVGRAFRVFLGGITLRAGKTHCYVLKSGYLWEFLLSFE